MSCCLKIITETNTQIILHIIVKCIKYKQIKDYSIRQTMLSFSDLINKVLLKVKYYFAHGIKSNLSVQVETMFCGRQDETWQHERYYCEQQSESCQLTMIK